MNTLAYIVDTMGALNMYSTHPETSNADMLHVCPLLSGLCLVAS